MHNTPEKRRVYQAAHYRENKVRKLANAKRWTAANSDRARDTDKAYRKANKGKVLANARKWYKNNSDRTHGYQTMRKYGLGVAEYRDMLAAQDGRCAICLRSDTGVRLCVDHSHVTGRVRGLLCRKCNTGIGMLDDSQDNLTRAKAYLARHGATNGI